MTRGLRERESSRQRRRLSHCEKRSACAPSASRLSSHALRLARSTPRIFQYKSVTALLCTARPLQATCSDMHLTQARVPLSRDRTGVGSHATQAHLTPARRITLTHSRLHTRSPRPSGAEDFIQGFTHVVLSTGSSIRPHRAPDPKPRSSNPSPSPASAPSATIRAKLSIRAHSP